MALCTSLFFFSINDTFSQGAMSDMTFDGLVLFKYKDEAGIIEKSLPQLGRAGRADPQKLNDYNQKKLKLLSEDVKSKLEVNLNKFKIAVAQKKLEIGNLEKNYAQLVQNTSLIDNEDNFLEFPNEGGRAIEVSPIAERKKDKKTELQKKINELKRYEAAMKRQENELNLCEKEIKKLDEVLKNTTVANNTTSTNNITGANNITSTTATTGANNTNSLSTNNVSQDDLEGGIDPNFNSLSMLTSGPMDNNASTDINKNVAALRDNSPELSREEAKLSSDPTLFDPPDNDFPTTIPFNPEKFDAFNGNTHNDIIPFIDRSNFDQPNYVVRNNEPNIRVIYKYEGGSYKEYRKRVSASDGTNQLNPPTLIGNNTTNLGANNQLGSNTKKNLVAKTDNNTENEQKQLKSVNKCSSKLNICAPLSEGDLGYDKDFQVPVVGNCNVVPIDHILQLGDLVRCPKGGSVYARKIDENGVYTPYKVESAKFGWCVATHTACNVLFPFQTKGKTGYNENLQCKNCVPLVGGKVDKNGMCDLGTSVIKTGASEDMLKQIDKFDGAAFSKNIGDTLDIGTGCHVKQGSAEVAQCEIPSETNDEFHSFYNYCVNLGGPTFISVRATAIDGYRNEKEIDVSRNSLANPEKITFARGDIVARQYVDVYIKHYAESLDNNNTKKDEFLKLFVTKNGITNEQIQNSLIKECQNIFKGTFERLVGPKPNEKEITLDPAFGAADRRVRGDCAGLWNNPEQITAKRNDQQGNAVNCNLQDLDFLKLTNSNSIVSLERKRFENNQYNFIASKSRSQQSNRDLRKTRANDGSCEMYIGFNKNLTRECEELESISFARWHSINNLCYLGAGGVFKDYLNNNPKVSNQDKGEYVWNQNAPNDGNATTVKERFDLCVNATTGKNDYDKLPLTYIAISDEDKTSEFDKAEFVRRHEVTDSVNPENKCIQYKKILGDELRAAYPYLGMVGDEDKGKLRKDNNLTDARLALIKDMMGEGKGGAECVDCYNLDQLEDTGIAISFANQEKLDGIPTLAYCQDVARAIQKAKSGIDCSTKPEAALTLKKQAKKFSDDKLGDLYRDHLLTCAKNESKLYGGCNFKEVEKSCLKVLAQFNSNKDEAVEGVDAKAIQQAYADKFFDILLSMYSRADLSNKELEDIDKVAQNYLQSTTSINTLFNPYTVKDDKNSTAQVGSRPQKRYLEGQSIPGIEPQVAANPLCSQNKKIIDERCSLGLAGFVKKLNDEMETKKLIGQNDPELAVTADKNPKCSDDVKFEDLKDSNPGALMESLIIYSEYSTKVTPEFFKDNSNYNFYCYKRAVKNIINLSKSKYDDGSLKQEVLGEPSNNCATNQGKENLVAALKKTCEALYLDPAERTKNCSNIDIVYTTDPKNPNAGGGKKAEGPTNGGTTNGTTDSDDTSGGDDTSGETNGGSGGGLSSYERELIESSKAAALAASEAAQQALQVSRGTQEMMLRFMDYSKVAHESGARQLTQCILCTIGTNSQNSLAIDPTSFGSQIILNGNSSGGNGSAYQQILNPVLNSFWDHR